MSDQDILIYIYNDIWTYWGTSEINFNESASIRQELSESKSNWDQVFIILFMFLDESINPFSSTDPVTFDSIFKRGFIKDFIGFSIELNSYLL